MQRTTSPRSSSMTCWSRRRRRTSDASLCSTVCLEVIKQSSADRACCKEDRVSFFYVEAGPLKTARSALDVDDGSGGKRWRDPPLLTLANGHNNRHTSRPRWQHIGNRQELQGKGRQQQGMEPDEPPCQDHRRHVEQFIGKRPPEGTQEQLEQIGRHRDGVSEPHALSCENGRLEYLQECLKHLVNEYTDSRRNIVKADFEDFEDSGECWSLDIFGLVEDEESCPSPSG